MFLPGIANKEIIRLEITMNDAHIMQRFQNAEHLYGVVNS